MNEMIQDNTSSGMRKTLSTWYNVVTVNASTTP